MHTEGGTKTSATLLFCLVIVAWGLNFAFIRIGLSEAPPLWLAFMRAGIGTAGIALWRSANHKSRRLSGAELRDALIIGLPNTAIFYGALFVGELQVPPGTTAVVIYTFPLWISLLSAPLLRRPLRLSGWLSIAVGFAGIVLVAQPWSQAVQGAKLPFIFILLIGAISWAVGTVLVKRRFEPEAMGGVNLWQMASGTFVLFIAALLFEPATAITPGVQLVVALIWLGLIGSTFAYVAWYILLGKYNAEQLSTWTFMVPVTALIASVFLFGESLSPVQVAGVLLVLSSIYGVNRAAGT
ncbi:MAG: EamA family transporter [Methanomassiliicoccales archaeon]|nr:EamA family transporter [Methanomassiliicoccales archaeon]